MQLGRQHARALERTGKCSQSQRGSSSSWLGYFSTERLKRRNKDHSPVPQGYLIGVSLDHCRVTNTLTHTKAGIIWTTSANPELCPFPHRLHQGLELVTTGKGWAWVTEGSGLLGLQSAGGHC